MFSYVKYILWLKNTFSFRLVYLLEKIGKITVITLNRIFHKNISYCYLLRRDYKIFNSDGIWNIKHSSDYDTLISPLFEPELRTEFRLQSPGYFIDIGAHIGKWSIYIAKQDVRNKVLAIDANKYTFAYLEKNIIDNHLSSQIHAVNIGLSHESGAAIFDYDTVNTGTSGIGLGKTGEWVEKIEVALKTFDRVISENSISIEDIRMIKIDVEGHEGPVFEGMKWFLESKKQGITIICEIHNTNPEKSKILQFMKDYGYSLRFVTGDTVDHIFYK